MLIQCNECGNQISDKATTCPSCGAPIERNIYCTKCGTSYNEKYASCPSCGTYNPNCPSPPSVIDDLFSSGKSGRSRGIAAILAFFFGALGVHYFYLGKNSAGWIILVVDVLTCFVAAAVFSIMSLIQAILMLTMTQVQFENRYINTPSKFPF